MPGSDRIQPALIALAVALAYFNAPGAAFQFDDYNVIVNNPAVHSLAAWFDSMPGIRPLLKFSYALNWTLDAAPAGFHLFNVVIHAINAVLVYRLLRALPAHGPGGRWAPLLAALLFALHPVQTEAVTYVCGRSVSLMATFYLLSLLAWLHAERVAHAGRWRALSAALFAAALLVKETAVTLPLALLLLDTLAVRRLTANQMLRRQGWHWLVSCGGLLAFAASPVYRHLFEVSVATRAMFDNLLTQVRAITYLAGQLLLPWRMNIDPDLPVLTSVTPVLMLEGMAICALIFFALLSLRRRPWLAFAILWFFLHLLPTNSVLPRLDVANDRQLYLASIGAFYALAIGMQEWMRHARRAWPACAVFALLLLVLGAATVQRNQAYASAVAFWEDAFEKSPGKPRVANNLGYAYQQAGRYAQAELAYRRAIELDPDYGQAHINLDVLQSARPR